MRVVRFFICGSLILSGALGALPAAHAFAQGEIRVRTGEHKGYSRFVIDGLTHTKHTLDHTSTSQVVILLADKGHLGQGGFRAVPNIAGFSVLSEDPLKIALNIAKGSKVKDIAAGEHVVVIDVYDPPAKPPPPKVEVKKAESAKVEIAEKTPPSVKSPMKELPKDAALKEPPQTALARAPQVVLPPVKSSVKVAVKTPDAPLKPLPIEAKSVPSLVTYSSTQIFGMAAFMLERRLFLVNDKKDLLMVPQVSGPEAERLGVLEEVKASRGDGESSKGQGHVFSVPDGTKIRGQGGGLIWRVLLAPDLEVKAGSAPSQKDVQQDEARSGTLFWPLSGARAVLSLTDTLTGRMVKVVTVDSAMQLGGGARHYVDFDVLETAVGLAIAPKVDDLEVRLVEGGVEITRPEGLTLVDDEISASVAQFSVGSPPTQVLENAPAAESAPALPVQKLFDFKGWQLGGPSVLSENRTIILGSLKDLSDSEKIESLMTLAKMYIANTMGAEALAILRLAAQEMPALEESPEFIGLLGVADALCKHSEDAFRELSTEALKPYAEINFWRAYALADLGDWKQAAEVMPTNLEAIKDYPDLISGHLWPVLAEVALRAGNLDLGQKMLDMTQAHKKTLEISQSAALDYLKGEAARQKGDFAETKKLWGPLTKGPDDLYRVKAGVALTRLLLDKKEIKPAEAMDALERLRYAWRGDELEAQVNFWLGRTYFEAGQYIKGLKIMREAAGMAPETNLAHRIASDMIEIFTGLFLGAAFEKVSPLDAVALYEEFSELVPLDDRGNQIVERLAENLVKADLLTRAGDLLNDQIEKKRLSGERAFRVAVRLAAIRLLDEAPVKALAALNFAVQKLGELPPALKTPDNYRTVALLRARALSRQGRPDQALALLEGMEHKRDVNRLRADIAWSAGYWDDAAEALGDVLIDQAISMTRPLSDENLALIMQRAIALNLSSDRIALAGLREKYTDLMNQTEKAKIFEVITRPRQSGALADRDTLLGIVSEVDLFGDFLKNYKNTPVPVGTK